MKEIKYPLAKDTISNADMDSLANWIKTHPRLTMGELTVKYEEKWNSWLGRKFSVFCNSGSSANLLMYYALLVSGKLKNKKVVVPSAAWVTSISPAIQLGFEPIMCEADKDTYGLDLKHLEELLKEYGPSTVFLVHVLGVPHKMVDLMALKDKYGFYLLEDACAAMGSTYLGRKVGTFGDMSSISTYFGHQFSTIEGGMVSTDDEDLYTLVHMLRSHGWIKGLAPQVRSKLLDGCDMNDIGTDFVFIYPGFNLRPTDLQAYIGIEQLDKMDWLVEKRFRNHQLYKKLLSPYFQTPNYDNESVVCSIHFCVLAENFEEKKIIMQALNEAGIETRPFTSGNQGMQPYWYRRNGGYDFFTGPMAKRLFMSGFFLPNNPSLTKEDIEYIVSVVKKASLNRRMGAK